MPEPWPQDGLALGFVRSGTHRIDRTMSGRLAYSSDSHAPSATSADPMTTAAVIIANQPKE